MGKLEQKLPDTRDSGSPWQQEAIRRINPLLRELATNVGNTINYLNKNQLQLSMPQYRDYVQTNADLASELHSMIADFVDYGKTKQKFQALQQKLDFPAQ